MANNWWKRCGLVTDEDKKAIEVHWENERKEREAKRLAFECLDMKPPAWNIPIPASEPVQKQPYYTVQQFGVTDDRTLKDAASLLNEAKEQGRKDATNGLAFSPFTLLAKAQACGLSRRQIKKVYRIGWEQGNNAKLTPPLKEDSDLAIFTPIDTTFKEDIVQNYKTIVFHNGDKAIAFVDKYWDRVLDIESSVSGFIVKLGPLKKDTSEMVTVGGGHQGPTE